MKNVLQASSQKRLSFLKQIVEKPESCFRFQINIL